MMHSMGKNVSLHPASLDIRSMLFKGTGIENGVSLTQFKERVKQDVRDTDLQNYIFRCINNLIIDHKVEKQDDIIFLK